MVTQSHEPKERQQTIPRQSGRQTGKNVPRWRFFVWGNGEVKK